SSARGSEPAGQHAVVAKTVLDQVAIVGPVVRGPKNHLLAPPSPVGNLILLIGLGTHPADAVVVNLLVHRSRPEWVVRFEYFTGKNTVRTEELRPRRCDVE